MKPKALITLKSFQSPEPSNSHGGPCSVTRWELGIEDVLLDAEFLRRPWIDDHRKYTHFEYAPSEMKALFLALTDRFDPPGSAFEGEAAGYVAKANVLKTRGKNNSLHDINQAADMLEAAAMKIAQLPRRNGNLEVVPFEEDRTNDLLSKIRQLNERIAELDAPTPVSSSRVPDLTNEQKEMTLLRIIEASGGNADVSESKWSWINWFCSDEIHNVQDDTFNRCNEKGWLHTTHDTSFDTSTTTLTAAGRAALSATATDPHAREEGGITCGRNQMIRLVLICLTLSGCCTSTIEPRCDPMLRWQPVTEFVKK